MKQRYLLVLYPLVAALSGASVTATRTYYRDVLPILQIHGDSGNIPHREVASIQAVQDGPLLA